jgi:hypothetical protein
MDADTPTEEKDCCRRQGFLLVCSNLTPGTIVPKADENANRQALVASHINDEKRAKPGYPPHTL